MNSQPLLERGVGGGVVATMRKQDVLNMSSSLLVMLQLHLSVSLGGSWIPYVSTFGRWGVGRGILMHVRLECALHVAAAT
jgi:hypothetical protein